jgi:hypothetical protein
MNSDDGPFITPSSHMGTQVTEDELDAEGPRESGWEYNSLGIRRARWNWIKQHVAEVAQGLAENRTPNGSVRMPFLIRYLHLTQFEKDMVLQAMRNNGVSRPHLAWGYINGRLGPAVRDLDNVE